MLWQRHWSSHVLTRRDFGQLRQHQALLKYIALWSLETCVGQNVNSQNQGLVIRVARGSQSHIISMAVLFSKSSASDRFYKRSLGCNTKTLSLRELFSMEELHKYISKRPNSTNSLICILSTDLKVLVQTRVLVDHTSWKIFLSSSLYQRFKYNSPLAFCISFKLWLLLMMLVP